MSVEPPLLMIVPGLDAPWKIITDRCGYKSLLVRHDTLISEHLVNMINDIYAERCYIDRLRQLLAADNPRWLPVPSPRVELTGLQLLELKETVAQESRSGASRVIRYSISRDGSPQEN